MRLTIPQKMVGMAIFVTLVTLIVGPMLWLAGMPLADVLWDRALNILLILSVTIPQEQLRRFLNRLIEPWRGRKRHQVLRPILGIGSVFLIQGVVYLLLMPLLRASEMGLLLGTVNLLAGSIVYWVWQEKWRWLIASLEWGKRRVRVRLMPVQRRLAQLAKRRTV